MKDEYDYIINRPSWLKLVIQKSERAGCKLVDVEDFLIDFLTNLDICMMSDAEYSAYDDYERDSFLDSFFDQLLENYAQGTSKTVDDIESYEAFILDVLWSGCLRRIIKDFDNRLGNDDGYVIERLRIHSRKVVVQYSRMSAR